MNNEKKELTARDLALFLGCEIEWMGERGYTLIGINAGDEYFNPVGVAKEDWKLWAKFDEVRPALRPVSAITEQEARRAYEIENGKAWEAQPHWLEDELRERSCAEKYWNKCDEWYIENIKAVIGDPAVWAYFLSIGLDVFGWIPAGLAVDATKKEVEP